MKVQMKLFASLRDRLPAETGGIVDLDVADGTTPQMLIERYGIPPESVHLLMVNGIYVAPERSGERLLREGDVVAMWPPIAGG